MGTRPDGYDERTMLHPGDPGYVVVYNDGGTYRYLVCRRFGRHYTPARFRQLEHHGSGYGWTTNPKRATVFGWVEPAITRAQRFAHRGAWVEPVDHI